jgi:hypothetical protein
VSFITYQGIWFIKGTTALAKYVNTNNFGKMSGPPGRVIYVRFVIKKNAKGATGHVQMLQSLIAVYYKVHDVATLTERRILQGLTNRTLCEIVDLALARGEITQDSPISLKVSGHRWGAENDAKLFRFYETLGFKGEHGSDLHMISTASLIRKSCMWRHARRQKLSRTRSASHTNKTKSKSKKRKPPSSSHRTASFTRSLSHRTGRGSTSRTEAASRASPRSRSTIARRSRRASRRSTSRSR